MNQLRREQLGNVNKDTPRESLRIYLNEALYYIDTLTAENARLAERATGAESRSLEMAQSIAELDKELFDTSRRAEAAEARVIELETALNDIIERDPEYFQRLIEDDEALAAALAEQGDAVVPRG